MGLARTATHVIWAIALIGAAGLALDAYFDTAPRIAEARDDAHRRAGERLDTRVESASFCWGDDKVRVTATNRGARELVTSEVGFLLDGVLVSTFFVDVSARDNASIWPPGETAVFNLTDVPVEPARLVLVLPAGERSHAAHTTCPILTSILVSPSAPSMAIGESRVFQAEGFDQHGVAYPTSSFAWSSSCGTVTPLDGESATFLAGTTAGPCALEASADGVAGVATIAIRPDAPATLVLSPDPVGVPAGGTQAFTATARDAYGNVNATAPVSWSTNAGAIDAAGVLTAQTLAQTGRSVGATSGVASGSAAVDVYAATAATVTVSPASATLAFNETQAFTATVRDAYGNANASAPVAWSATRGNVTSAGLYTAPATGGTATVTATSQGQGGQATITVVREVHVDTMLTYKSGIESSSFRKGVDTIEVRVTLRDHENALVAGAAVTVEFVDNDGVVRSTQTATSGANGIASVSYAPPNSASQGAWTARVTTLVGTHVLYDSAANVVTSVGFQVTAN